MYQFRLFKLLLKPSLLSGIGSLIAASALLIAPNEAILQKQSFIYEVFYGPNGLATSLQGAQGNAEGLGAALSETPLAYIAIMFVLSVLAGLLTFLVLQGLHRLFVDVSEPVREVRIAGSSSRASVEREIGTRALTRITALVLWCIYWLATVKILWPFCLLLFGSGVQEITTFNGIQSVAFAIAVMTLALHLHIVFLRLTLLRPRAFGGQRAIRQALY